VEIVAVVAGDIHDYCCYSHCTHYIAVVAVVAAVVEFGHSTEFDAAADAADGVHRDGLVWLLILLLLLPMMELRSTDCTVVSVFHSRCVSSCSGRAISSRNLLRRTYCLCCSCCCYGCCCIVATHSPQSISSQ